MLSALSKLLNILVVKSYSTKVKIMPKFCANLSFMFTEKPFEERYKLAESAGFKAVESGFPFGLTRDQVVKAKQSTNVEQVLINIFTGDVTKGELGFAAIPRKEKEFKDSLNVTIDYAKHLGAKKLHIMAGRVENITLDHDESYEANLRYATKILEHENIIGLIEPINKYSVPHYYLNSYERAISVIKSINSPNLKLMLDVFHLQQIQGDISHAISNLTPYIGHVQIAQVPHRNEPNTLGEIDFRYVFKALDDVYNDWIGLEYKPATTSEDGLKWVEEFGYTL